MTSSDFNFNYNQSLPHYESTTEDTEAMIFFTAGAGTTYTISGLLSALGSDYSATIDVSLFDWTTADEGYVYYDDSTQKDTTSLNATATLNLQSTVSSGPLTGTLIDGDLYQFTAEEYIVTSTKSNTSGIAEATVNSDSFAEISFAPAAAPVPLPGSAPAGLLLLTLVGIGAFCRGQSARLRR
jgi:hypothetical protein